MLRLQYMPPRQSGYGGASSPSCDRIGAGAQPRGTLQLSTGPCDHAAASREYAVSGATSLNVMKRRRAAGVLAGPPAGLPSSALAWSSEDKAGMSLFR
jgi:hypothetical protein